MFISDLQSKSFMRVWVFLLKDSVPCPIPWFQEADEQPPLLPKLKIQDATGYAIAKLNAGAVPCRLRPALLPKGHKIMARIVKNLRSVNEIPYLIGT
ncbi:hypothetical protein KYK29_12625 [Shinella daejeonensis]|uniref:hypothetical protein n=1 Tax=Shinella daejeonensis TaxID=659017 RepID=UPI0020C7F69B|nr:hypothetical protein [Shinella daejeonensis]MCP8895768.1 hypothetical protein [Shinella daejeonensis]